MGELREWRGWRRSSNLEKVGVDDRVNPEKLAQSTPETRERSSDPDHSAFLKCTQAATMRRSSVPTRTTSPGWSCRPRLSSGSPLTVTSPLAIRALASAPPEAAPASLSSWPRRIMSPAISINCSTRQALQVRSGASTQRAAPHRSRCVRIGRAKLVACGARGCSSSTRLAPDTPFHVLRGHGAGACLQREASLRSGTVRALGGDDRPACRFARCVGKQRCDRPSAQARFRRPGLRCPPEVRGGQG
jgi:hypothetical protein